MRAENLSYEPIYELLENPDDALAEIFIRGRHSNGDVIPPHELKELGDRFWQRMRSSEWMTRYGDLIMEETRRQGNF